MRSYNRSFQIAEKKFTLLKKGEDFRSAMDVPLDHVSTKRDRAETYAELILS
jgi:hypothetical protein